MAESISTQWEECKKLIRKLCPTVGNDPIAEYLIIVRTSDGQLLGTGSSIPGRWKELMNDFAKELK